jgi:streptogramin lyase
VVGAITSRVVAIGWWLLPFALLLIVASGVHGQALPAGPGDSSYSLPKDTEPREMALASDGAVWMVNGFSGLTRLGPAGGTRQFLQSDDQLGAIAAGPNGSVWVEASGGLLQIDPAGRLTRPPTAVDGSVVAPTSVGDVGLWLASEAGSGYRWSIVRLSADGTSREFRFRAPREAFELKGVAQAPDGSVWFTESGLHHHAWIGRMTAAGAFAHRALPRSVGEPGRIATGSDGAAWFTGRHTIAHIAPGGQIQ